MSGFKLQRLGMVMEPEPGNPQEVEGVLNPAAARGPDGELYLFPRLVAKGNYSRIGIARVRFNEAGDPAGVERLGIALEPEADYERRPDGGGGCEDPRITFVEPLQRYMMTYTAFSVEAHGSPWPYRRTSSTGSAWGSRPLAVSRHRIRRRG
jgi:beta-1,2-mannobiose phosphorylase / 1,2-beta-oligomannan phosphorylase